MFCFRRRIDVKPCCHAERSEASEEVFTSGILPRMLRCAQHDTFAWDEHLDTLVKNNASPNNLKLLNNNPVLLQKSCNILSGKSGFLDSIPLRINRKVISRPEISPLQLGSAKNRPTEVAIAEYRV